MKRSVSIKRFVSILLVVLVLSMTIALADDEEHEDYEHGHTAVWDSSDDFHLDDYPAPVQLPPADAVSLPITKQPITSSAVMPPNDSQSESLIELSSKIDDYLGQTNIGFATSDSYQTYISLTGSGNDGGGSGNPILDGIHINRSVGLFSKDSFFGRLFSFYGF